MNIKSQKRRRRAQIAKLKATAKGCMIAAAESQRRAERAESEMHAISDRLRSIARHTWALPVDKKARIPASHTRAPGPVEINLGINDDRPSAILMPRDAHIRLMHLMMWAQDNRMDFARYIHFEVVDKETGPKYGFSQAVSHETLAMMKGWTRADFARHMGELFGAAIWQALNK